MRDEVFSAADACATELHGRDHLQRAAYATDSGADEAVIRTVRTDGRNGAIATNVNGGAGGSSERTNDGGAGRSSERTNDGGAAGSSERANDGAAARSIQRANEGGAGRTIRRINDGDAGGISERANEGGAGGRSEPANEGGAGGRSERANDGSAGRISQTASGGTPVIEVTDLVKDYSRGENVVHALRSVSLAVRPGEFVAIMGPSGSGKSTFMNLIGCLDRPTSGSYLLDGVEVTSLKPTQLADLRNQKIGFIFQGFNLLARMDALDNVMLPMVYAGVPKAIREQRAQAALEAVGLGSRMHHRSNELSGGQQQRVAIARALVNAPSLILADEPTGNLDSRTSIEIMGILQRLNAAGATIVLVTHEPDIATYCSRTVVFKDGVVLSDEPNREIARAYVPEANGVVGASANAAAGAR